MASMIGNTGFVSKYVSLDNTDGAMTLETLGFSDAEIAAADSAHISVFSKPVRYWYSGEVPTETSGHQMVVGSERIFRGIRNLRQLQMIAESGVAKLAITLASFSRVG